VFEILFGTKRLSSDSLFFAFFWQKFALKIISNYSKLKKPKLTFGLLVLSYFFKG
jgi:hypothetical protein